MLDFEEIDRPGTRTTERTAIIDALKGTVYSGKALLVKKRADKGLGDLYREMREMGLKLRTRKSGTDLIAWCEKIPGQA